MVARKGSTEPVKVFTEDRICITPEKICAQIDGAEEFSDAEKKHLRHCKKCHELRESYKFLDDAVSKALDVECPPAAQLRIRKKVARHIRQKTPIGKRPEFRYTAWAIRIAAIFVLFTMVCYLVFVDNPFSPDPARIAGTEPLEVPNIAQSSFSPAPPPYENFTGNPIDVRHTRLASTSQQTSNVRFTEEKPLVPKAEKIALIPSKIKHVWVYDPALKTSDAEKLLRAALTKVNIPLKGIKLTMNPKGGVRVLLEVNRYQAVMLTRELAKSFQLLSSQQPQPEQKLFAGNGRELVKCELVLMPREK